MADYVERGVWGMRLKYTTIPGVDEFDVREFRDNIINAFNDYHEIERNIPPPYLAVDIGKVVGICDAFLELAEAT